MAPRKICVVTGTRAEYGLLRWLMEEIVRDDALVLQIIVTGAHLAPRFGETWREIEADGFSIDERVDIGIENDTPVAIAHAMGRGIPALAEAFGTLQPDLVVLLGDRYEILAAAQAATLLRLPVAHIHGGELTEGALDDCMRHAITKLAHLHFTAAAAYRRRVIQLGEDPARVFNVGALGLEAVRRLRPMTRDQLADSLGIALGTPLLLVTYHPETAGARPAAGGVRALADALSCFPEACIVFTGVNADPENQAVSKRILEFVEAHPESARYHASLGQRRYLSLMSHADAVVGNSSSGIIEAPAMGVPTVNIGNRQKGRLRSPSVIDCGEAASEIRQAISQALSPESRKTAEQKVSAYDSGDTAIRIHEKLRDTDLSGITAKHFHDLTPDPSAVNAK